jgi:hypothetical protein
MKVKEKKANLQQEEVKLLIYYNINRLQKKQ